MNNRIDEFNQDDDDNGRCPNCGEDELQFGTDCQYCGWPDYHDWDRIDVV